ncbi:unnamed protein product [Rotaria magnacalcarata]|uniref:PiggyBac transposable element-derived protein domain-containing protein n=3 Tax=Rotaria magnacalcarata TaxID=392030 RepID=A0A820EUF2_9BILA|nr:unnamed protein product [Rotaria magnacalcarata]
MVERLAQQQYRRAIGSIRASRSIYTMTILDAFKLFFTNEMLELIVLHTNLYAKRYYDKKIRPRHNSNNIRSDSHFWKPVDRIELESFIELLIQSGVHRSNHELLNDLWDIRQKNCSCRFF